MKIRREFPHFAAWDARGMAAHLEAMEAKGWQFRGADWLGRWEYIPCEPNTVRWAVAYAPSRKNWRLTPTEAERDLEDICFDAGWRKIAALSRFHIYRNPDPNATDLETDETVRLDTLDRSLTLAAGIGTLVWLLVGTALLAVLLWALYDHMPRTLAIQKLPFSLLFTLWLIVSQTVPWLMYRRWLRAARRAADSGQPCPEVRGWRSFSRWCHGLAAVLLLWIAAGGELAMLLVYGVVLCGFYGLRHLLAHRMYDEALAEGLWQVLLVVMVIVLFGLNRWYTGTGSRDPRTDAIPLMAQDLWDTGGMELMQFDTEDKESLLASYHDYWQTDEASSFHLQYTVFDLRLPLLEKPCEAWFLDRFDHITERDALTVTDPDPALWGAEQVYHSTTEGQDQWLIFYEGRTVQLFASWNLTGSDIATAAEKLAP